MKASFLEVSHWKVARKTHIAARFCDIFTIVLKEASAEVDALEKELKREMEKESTPATTETNLKTIMFS